MIFFGFHQFVQTLHSIPNRVQHFKRSQTLENFRQLSDHINGCDQRFLSKESKRWKPQKRGLPNRYSWGNQSESSATFRKLNEMLQKGNVTKCFKRFRSFAIISVRWALHFNSFEGILLKRIASLCLAKISIKTVARIVFLSLKML